MKPVRLTVVVAPVRDGTSLPGCLDALRNQDRPPPMEVIVPYDGSVRNLPSLRREYPEVHFVEVSGTGAHLQSGSIGAAHLAIDRRRAAALSIARGEIIAVTDEDGRPEHAWCRLVSQAHVEHPGAVIGGAMVNVRPRTVNWALFFMDAGRYQNPVPQDPVRYVTDVNVSYKREALLRVRAVWHELYVETAVHDAIAALGQAHHLRRDLVMGIDRGKIGIRYALAERFSWARLYASRRGGALGSVRRAALTVGAPLLGPLLAIRQGSLAMRRGRHRMQFVRCLPVLLVMDAVWSVGEMVGYATGRGTPRS